MSGMKRASDAEREVASHDAKRNRVKKAQSLVKGRRFESSRRLRTSLQVDVFAATGADSLR